MKERKKSSSKIGAKIKTMRRAKKIALQELANETGYSPDYIKKIEEGKITPPVGVLLQLSKAMAIDSGKLLTDEEKEEKRVKGYLKRTQAYSYQTLTPGAERKHLSAFLVTIEPKKDHRMVEYRHEGEEFIYVLEGKLEVMVGENRNVVPQGKSIHFNSAITHKLNNLSDVEAKLLVVIYTP
ncbi:MAG: cupin domain-containing protein [Candidatus Bathyarchaeia archaeon]